MLEEIKASHSGEKEILAFLETPGGIKGIEAFDQGRNLQSDFLKNLIIKKEGVEKTLKLLIDREKEKRDQFSAGELIDELDHAEREIWTNTNAKLIERKIKEIKKIESLIRRAQSDEEFGLCEECGEPIAEDRLIIVPEATRCVPCQQELEKLESRSGSSGGHASPSHWKKGVGWESNDGFDDDEGIIIKTDMDYTSFVDMEEIELDENSRPENSG